jgi:peptidoglycan/LPS O-acetylase OafA/YrhL
MNRQIKDMQRNPNLDLLRIISLLAIVSYHVLQRWPTQLPSLVTAVSSFGQYGVDIFFALSGWLVGLKLYSNSFAINPSKVLLRRIARVMPAYLAALLIAYLGVAFARGQYFNFVYLFLLQNYLDKIPFFLVSWFLCVLVQFYAFVWLLELAFRNRYRYILIVSLAGLALFPLFRIYLVASGSITEAMQFGYYLTAFHLRGDTILSSFCASLFSSMFAKDLQCRLPVQRISVGLLWLFVFVVWILLAIYRSEHYKLYYVFSPLLLALVCTPTVACCSNSAPFRLRPPPLILNYIVASLYSVYLTHPFAIEAAERFLGNNDNGFAYSILVTFLIASFSFCFYLIVEKPFGGFVGGFLARKAS